MMPWLVCCASKPAASARLRRWPAMCPAPMGGALSFAVVVNNPEDYAAARSAIDSFITKLAGL